MRIMQLEIVTEGVEFVVSRVPQAKNDADGRQKADRDTGELLFTTELVAMGHSGAEVFKVTTAGAPPVAKRQAVTVRAVTPTDPGLNCADSVRSSRPDAQMDATPGRQ